MQWRPGTHSPLCPGPRCRVLLAHSIWISGKARPFHVTLIPPRSGTLLTLDPSATPQGEPGSPADKGPPHPDTACDTDFPLLFYFC